MKEKEKGIENEHLRKWIEEMRLLCQPKDVQIIDGSDEENEKLIQKLIENKTVVKLKRPGSYLARSNPEDVARVEDRTFICSKSQEEAGPTNNWQEPSEMKKRLKGLFQGCMRGRTMYVVPYLMGPYGSPYAKGAVEITDSPYVVVNMRLMARVGKRAEEALGKGEFVKCLHSVGSPLEPGEKDVSWPCNTKETHIVHFPEEHEVWSFGSGYGGNALLNKKCFALRLASCMARDEGWLAEHMLIISVTNPEGEKKYFTGSFPSACGKTNLAMLSSTLNGWKVECVGDDIAWMHWGKDGRLYAINPEAGFFGVAPGTSMKSNPNAMRTIDKNTIFTNVALTDAGDVWWEGMTDTAPEHLINWKNQNWPQASMPTEKAAHPNARFTVATSQCPVVDSLYEAPLGVPISGIILGGRRSTTMPLVRQALSWEHGVFLGASMTSETTAAAKGEVGKLRHDPFAMLPFCGYNMGDYFAHWLKQKTDARKCPEIFYVNWFLKDESGKFIWPGFGENMKVLKWMCERIDGKAKGVTTPIGILPEAQALGCSPQLLEINKEGWREEAKNLALYFATFGKKLPQELIKEQKKLQKSFA